MPIQQFISTSLSKLCYSVHLLLMLNKRRKLLKEHSTIDTILPSFNLPEAEENSKSMFLFSRPPPYAIITKIPCEVFPSFYQPQNLKLKKGKQCREAGETLKETIETLGKTGKNTKGNGSKQDTWET